MTTKIFVGLSVLLLLLVGIAAAKDSHDRQYLAIQDQYRADYAQQDSKAQFDTTVQQLFPAFTQAKRGDTFRVERCISCHVPNIGKVGPEEAARRLWQEFQRYEPDAAHIAQANHLTGNHPAYIDQSLYNRYGATGTGFTPYSVAGSQNGLITPDMVLAGPIPAFLDPKTLNKGSPVGIDQVGCIVCHNGGRLALDQTTAHQNLIVNPEYSFTAGAALYYKNCATCHGALGEGAKGPPLNNQDRLGFFNEDYYYRCIEYGATDFEHIGSVMPNWGGVASDYTGPKPPYKSRQLSEDQISLLIQFIRHWENYDTLP